MRKTVTPLALLFFFHGAADAACLQPAGVEGEMVYNQAHKVLQYCDGDTWYGLGWKNAPKTPASGAAGEIQFSNGNGSFLSSPGFKWSSDTNTLQVPGTIQHVGAMADVARPVCYSAMKAGAVNKGLIMIPLPAYNANLNTSCSSRINPGWSALGVVKSNLYGQNCSQELTNLSYGGGYTSFIARASFEAIAATNYNLCGPANAIICCVPTSDL